MQDWEMSLEEPPCSGGADRKHKCRICGEPSSCQTWRIARRLYWCADCYEKHAEERNAYSAQQYSTQKGPWDWWDWKRGRHLKITYLKDKVGRNFELNRRTYLPIIVEDECPVCGDLRVVDLRKNYLMYPGVNGEVEIGFVCGEDLCDDDPKHQHEGLQWSRKFTLQVRLEQVRATPCRAVNREHG